MISHSAHRARSAHFFSRPQFPRHFPCNRRRSPLAADVEVPSSRALLLAGFAIKWVQGAVREAGRVENRYHRPLATDCATWVDEGDVLEETDADALGKLYAKAGRAAAAMLFGLVGMRTDTLATGGEEEMLRALLHKRVYEALATVPERPREIIERRLLRDQEVKEVAEEMGLSVR